MFSEVTTNSLKQSFNWLAKGTMGFLCGGTLLLGAQTFGLEGTALTISSLPAAASLCFLGGSMIFAAIGAASTTYDTYRAVKYILHI